MHSDACTAYGIQIIQTSDFWMPQAAVKSGIRQGIQSAYDRFTRVIVLPQASMFDRACPKQVAPPWVAYGITVVRIRIAEIGYKMTLLDPGLSVLIQKGPVVRRH